MRMLVRDSKPDQGQPEVIDMAAVDARHAVAADPERYSIEEHRPVVPSRSIEQRVSELEARLAKVWGEVFPPDEPEMPAPAPARGEDELNT